MGLHCRKRIARTWPSEAAARAVTSAPGMLERHRKRDRARLTQPFGLCVPDLRSVAPRTLFERRGHDPLLAVSLEEDPMGFPCPIAPSRGSWRTPAAAPVKRRTAGRDFQPVAIRTHAPRPRSESEPDRA